MLFLYDGSDPDAEAVGECIPIGFPRRDEANQESSDEDAAEVDPSGDSGGLDGDVEPELLFDDGLENGAEAVNHDDAKDAAGTKALALTWLTFLETQVAAAKDPESRGAFDSHVLSASLALGDPARAVARLKQSELELPADYNPPARLAVVYLEMGKLDEANAAAARALLRAYGPRRVRVLETMSRIQVKRNNPGGARQALEDAVAVLDALPPAQQPRGARARLETQLKALAAQ